ncbi:hypothetical protein OF83DRAFT_1088303 [Amylostereum chailletii]|nr:hypothetical protein OF83DRAFT_1088303 [Amylostereum chailletii]
MVRLATGKRARMDEGEHLRRQEAQLSMASDIAEAVEAYNEKAAELAEKHRKRPSYMKMALGLGAKKFGAKHAPTLWNGYLSHSLKAANEGLSNGERIHVSDFVAANSESLKENYQKLSKEEKEKFKAEALKAREEKATGLRLTRKSIAKDFQETWKGVVHELCPMSDVSRACAADRDINGIPPVVWATNSVESWMEMKNRGTTEDMALQIEGFNVVGCAKDAKKTKISK